MDNIIDISHFDYPLPSSRIAKFPLEERSLSKLLIWRDSRIEESRFCNVCEFLPEGSLLAFNNTKVVRARLLFRKSTGARIEIFCLEPHLPADYERAFSIHGKSSWHCIVGNSKKWKEGVLSIAYDGGVFLAKRAEGDTIDFEWSGSETFGEILEKLGRIPIPPYLERDSQEIDNSRYQTVYSRYEGSVAAPTAGLHFSPELMDSLRSAGFGRAEVTLHVGAGTFLPVKAHNAREHVMHTEFFDVTLSELEKLATCEGELIAVGTTSVRTLESLAVLGERVLLDGSPDAERHVGQWEAYDNAEMLKTRGLLGLKPLAALAEWMRINGLSHIYSSTQIMITPGYRFRTIRGLITNFHQPQSTLLLLISALVGEQWKQIYQYALDHDFRFLSYGDSSLLLRSDR